MPRFGLLAVAVLAGLLALSSTQNVFASTELLYDNGPPPDGSWGMAEGDYLAVKFHLADFGLSSVRLLKVRYFIPPFAPTPVLSFRAHIFGIDGVTDLLNPPLGLEVVLPSPPPTGWLDVDLTAYDIVVTEGFYVAIQYDYTNIPTIGYTLPNPHGHSYYKKGVGDWTLFSDQMAWDLIIRAVVDPVGGAPVGGVLTSANKLAILGPWLAVIGIVGCIGTVAVIAKKRRP